MAKISGHRTVTALARHRKVGLFLATGVLNTIFGYSAFAVLYFIIGNKNAALIIATVIGVIFNFFTTGRIVFNNKRASSFFPFCVAYSIALLVNIILLNLLTAIGVSVLIAQGASLPVTVIISYVINSRFVFQKASPSE